MRPDPALGSLLHDAPMTGDERLPRGDNVLLQMFRTGQATRALVLQATEGSGITPDEYAVLRRRGLAPARAAAPLAA